MRLAGPALGRGPLRGLRQRKGPVFPEFLPGSRALTLSCRAWAGVGIPSETRAHTFSVSEWCPLVSLLWDRLLFWLEPLEASMVQSQRLGTSSEELVPGEGGCRVGSHKALALGRLSQALLPSVGRGALLLPLVCGRGATQRSAGVRSTKTRGVSPGESQRGASRTRSSSFLSAYLSWCRTEKPCP